MQAVQQYSDGCLKTGVFQDHNAVREFGQKAIKEVLAEMDEKLRHISGDGSMKYFCPGCRAEMPVGVTSFVGFGENDNTRSCVKCGSAAVPLTLDAMTAHMVQVLAEVQLTKMDLGRRNNEVRDLRRELDQVLYVRIVDGKLLEAAAVTAAGDRGIDADGNECLPVNQVGMTHLWRKLQEIDGARVEELEAKNRRLELQLQSLGERPVAPRVTTRDIEH
ncbi:MAG: hypothetical protein AAGD32_17550 [Planctomycetota bacterium]